MGAGTMTVARGLGDAPRLSPKVRRLLREHGLAAGDVRGTGAGGRPTPDDVVATATGSAGDGPARRPDRGARPALASPLARRLLREAGLSLDDVPAVAANTPVTRSVVTRVLDDRDRAAGAPQPDAVDVDLTALLTAMARTDEVVQQRTGTALPLLAPVALATCRALRRQPALGGDARDVGLAVVVPTNDGPRAAAIAAAQDLTVTALADRLSELAARGARGELAADDAGFVLTDAAWVGDGGPSTTTVGLVLGAPTERTVEVTDALGQPATATRWVSTLRLTGATDDEVAAAFLADVQRELLTPTLLSDLA